MAHSTSASQLVRNALLIGMTSLMIFGCKGRDKSTTDTTVDQGTTTPVQETAVESAPMNFDAQGSDSNKIAGLSTVYFDYDKSTLSSSSRDALKGNAEWMKSNAKVSVQIEGHTDSRGSIEYNLALGERRANAVKAYLQSLGVPAARLKTISYGKERPIVSGESEDAWSKNRRANFVPVQ
jgi:peptidoglycan-associated lipoprotein